MTYLKLIAGILIITFTTFGQSTNRTQSKRLNVKRDNPSSIIFGIFCGECIGHCATMYRYNIIGSSKTLYVDTTDSYFKNFGKVLCKTQISDTSEFEAIDKLVQHIPKAFFTTVKTELTFGCPDCTDGCGIYFELRQDTTIRKFYIDYSTDKLEKDAKDFGEFVKTTIGELNKRIKYTFMPPASIRFTAMLAGTIAISGKSLIIFGSGGHYSIELCKKVQLWFS